MFNTSINAKHGVVRIKEVSIDNLCNGCMHYTPANCDHENSHQCMNPPSIAVPLELEVGDVFAGVLRTGQVIESSTVLRVDSWSKYPYQCEWVDQNGKHLEPFNLKEFKFFELLTYKEL